MTDGDPGAFRALNVDDAEDRALKLLTGGSLFAAAQAAAADRSTAGLDALVAEHLLGLGDLGFADGVTALQSLIVGWCQMSALPDEVVAAASVWQELGLSAGSSSAAPGEVGLSDRSQQLVASLSDAGLLSGFLWLLLAQIDGAAPSVVRSQRVPILVDRGDGDVATLTISLLANGPPGLHPDPRIMFATEIDSVFGDAVARAWFSSDLARGDRCVAWSLASSGEPLESISGPSAGAAAAVALNELNRRSRRRYRVRTLDGNAVVTAAVLDGDRLGEVGELHYKFRAAREHELRVVLASESRTAVDELASLRVSLPTVSYAATVADAVRATRKQLTRAARVAIAVVAIVAVAASSLVVLAERRGDRSELRANQTEVRRKVDQLRTQARDVGSRSGRDRTIQALLLLAAGQLAEDIGDDDLAAAVLSDGIEVGPGRLASVDLGGGDVTSVDAVRDGVIVGTGNGMVALVTPDTADVAAIRESGIRAETLATPIVRAVAEHPAVSMFAVTTQARSQDAQTLEVLSGPAAATSSEPNELTEVGQTRVSGERLLTLSYDLDGARLLGASTSGLVLFDVANPEPIEIGRCDAVFDAHPVQIWKHTDAAGAALVDLILANGSVQRVSAPWVPRVGPCEVTAVLPSTGGEAAVAVGDAGEARVASVGHGNVVVRTLNGETVTQLPVPDARVVENLQLSSDGSQVVIATVTEPLSDPSVAVFDVETAEQVATFPDVGPAVAHVGRGVLAEGKSGGMLDLLSIEGQVYIPGLRVPTMRTLSVAAGRSAFGTSDIAGRELNVYSFDPSQRARGVAVPAGQELATSGLLGTTFDVSDDGSMLAAIVMPTDGGYEDRVIRLWDAQRGVPVQLPDPDIEGSADRNPALNLQFVDGEDAFIVSFLRGDILRYDSERDWRPRVLRAGTDDERLWSLHVDSANVYTLLFDDQVEGSWRQRAVRIDLGSGNVTQDWDVSDLGLGLGPPDGASTPAFVVPTVDGRAAVVQLGGETVELNADGTVGRRLSLVSDAVTGLAVLPRERQLAVLTTRAPMVVDLDDFVAVTVGDRIAPVAAAQVTSDGRFLVGVAFALGALSISPLGNADRASSLCANASRELTTDEWRNYIGDEFEYRKLCEGSHSQAEGMFHAAREVANPVVVPVVADAPTIAEADGLVGECDRDTLDHGTAGALRWAVLSDDSTALVTAVICERDQVRWVVRGDEDRVGPPRILGGMHRDGSPMVTVAQRFRSDDLRTLVDVLDMSGFRGAFVFDDGYVSSIRLGGVEVLHRSGAMRLVTWIRTASAAASYVEWESRPDGPVDSVG